MARGRARLPTARRAPRPGAALDGPPAVAEIDGVPARRASRAVLGVLGLRVAAAGSGVVVAGVLSRHLGPSRFGELSLVFAVAFLASGVAELGTTQVVVGEMAARPERRAELAAGFALLRALTGALLGVAGALVLVALLHDVAAERAGLAVMSTLPLAAVSSLVVLAQARLRPEVAAALSLLQSVLWLLSVALVAGLGLGLAWYGIAFLGCALAQAAATWALVAGPARPAWERSRAAASRLARRAWPLAVATLLGTVYYRLDSVLVFRWAGPAQAGFYAAAYRFLDAFQLLPAAIAAVGLPVVARRWALGHRAGVERVFRLAVTLAAAAAVPVGVGTLLIGDRVAPAVFGARFAPAGEVLGVLGLAFLSIATGYVYSALLVATGRLRAVATVSAVAVVASVVADAVVIPTWGAVGAAWVTVGVEYLTSSTLAVWINHQYHLGFPWDRLRAVAGAGACMAAAVLAVGHAALPVVVAAGAATYAVAAALLGAVTRADVRALTDRRLPLGSTGP